MSNYMKWSDLGDKTPKTMTSQTSQTCPNIKNREDKQKLIDNNRVVVIDVHGEWCGPCKDIAPYFEELAKEQWNPGKCVLAKEDVDLELSQNIAGVPCFIFYKNGKYVDSVTGGDMPLIKTKLTQLLRDVQ
jgi:thioredoxin 1